MNPLETIFVAMNSNADRTIVIGAFLSRERAIEALLKDIEVVYTEHESPLAERIDMVIRAAHALRDAPEFSDPDLAGLTWEVQATQLDRMFP